MVGIGCGVRIALAVVLFGLAGCGLAKPGTPGHEPPSASNYNPVSGTRNGE